MPFEDLIDTISSVYVDDKNGYASFIYTDWKGNIVKEERVEIPSSAYPNPELELTTRELAETLIPDMTTVPMTDEEIQRFMLP